MNDKKKEDILQQLVKMAWTPDRSDDRAMRDHFDADKLLLSLIDDPRVTAAFYAINRHY